jgi:hypothetical protein
VIARYRPGSAVRCYYDPSTPSDAVLERSGLPLAPMAFGSGLLLFAAAGFVAGILSLRRPCACTTRARAPS